MPKLTESQTRELKILAFLSKADTDGSYFGFEALSSQTQIDRRQVRLDVRRMTRKGWTKFGKGLWTEEGYPAGSGYAITDSGRTVLVQSETQQDNHTGAIK